MLRLYLAQQCFGLSDMSTEDPLYDRQAVRLFVEIDRSLNFARNATTLLKFRRLLETHQVTQKIFTAINQHLSAKGLQLKEGTIADATLIAAAPSTKNSEGKHDPEKHQSKKGNQGRFDMKAHIGVYAASGLAHSLVTTAADVHDMTQIHALFHGEETIVFDDAGYVGAQKREENQDTPVKWQIAMHPGKRKALPCITEGKLLDQPEYLKAKDRAKVEEPLHVVKNRFQHRKPR